MKSTFFSPSLSRSHTGQIIEKRAFVLEAPFQFAIAGAEVGHLVAAHASLCLPARHLGVNQQIPRVHDACSRTDDHHWSGSNRFDILAESGEFFGRKIVLHRQRGIVSEDRIAIAKEGFHFVFDFLRIVECLFRFEDR